jgi:CheY-like chemotaxis protein
MSQKNIETVLMVDDDANIRYITELSLSGLTDWKVKTVSCGAEAVQTAGEEQFDLILLDMMMPDMDGITCFGELRSRLHAQMPPVIFMTAKARIEEVNRFYSIGAAGVITKPFDPMKLPEEIQSILTP